MKIIRPEVQQSLVLSGGLNNLFDIMVKEFYNITDEELDHICEFATPEELKIFTDATCQEDKPTTFSEIRQVLMIRNKYVEYYQK